MGHARALLMLDEEQQNQVAQLIVAKNLSVRETEKLVERIKAGKMTEKHEALSSEPNAYHDQLKALTQYLQTRVQLKSGKAGKGSVVIHYDNAQRLEKIISQLHELSLNSEGDCY